MKEVYSNLYNYLQLAMVIQETLHLYPALPVVTRVALQDIKFKDILIPKGMNMWVPVAMLCRELTRNSQTYEKQK